MEQYLRDVKIASIYEGANGIQSLDLLGRKMRIYKGEAFRAFMGEVEGFCKTFGTHGALGPAVQLLGKAAKRLGEVASEMARMFQTDPLQWASSTYPALLCFGDVTICWRLLDMAQVASKAMEKTGQHPFYAGKVFQATYYTDTTLPLTLARMETCLRSGREVVEIPEEAY